jgi:hypothetical protein
MASVSKVWILCYFVGFRSGAVLVSVRLGYCAASLCNWTPVAQRRGAISQKFNPQCKYSSSRSEDNQKHSPSWQMNKDSWTNNSIEQRPSWKACSRLAAQEIPRMLCTVNNHYRYHNSSQLLPNLSQFNLVHMLTPNFFAFSSMWYSYLYLKFVPAYAM